MFGKQRSCEVNNQNRKRGAPHRFRSQPLMKKGQFLFVFVLLAVGTFFPLKVPGQCGKRSLWKQ